MSNSAYLFSVPDGMRVKIADTVTVDDLDYGGMFMLSTTYGTATGEYTIVNGVMCRKFIEVDTIPPNRWLLIPSSDHGAAENFFSNAQEEKERMLKAIGMPLDG